MLKTNSKEELRLRKFLYLIVSPVNIKKIEGCDEEYRN